MGSEVVVTPKTDQVAATQALEPRGEKVPVLMGERGLQLANLAELYRFAQAVVASRLVPAGLDMPEKVLVAIQWGAELGLTPMASCRGIHVIDGMPSLSGQLALGLCWSRGVFGRVEGVRFTGDGDARAATFRAQRKGQTDIYEASFSTEDAKRAGLLGKKNWSAYRDDMLQWRSIGRWIKRYAPDVVLGLPITEEALDYERPAPREHHPSAQRHPVLAQLVGAKAEEPAPEPAEGPAEPSTPELVEVPFSAADAHAAILREAKSRVGDDDTAVRDFVREVTGGGIAKVKTREDAQAAQAKMAAHSRFGDAR